MRLNIRHTTQYEYAEPVPYGVLRLRLTPLTHPTQQVIDWTLAVEGGKLEFTYADAWGNRTDLITVARGASAISVTCAGTIDTADTAGVFRPSGPEAPLWLFERVTPLTTPGAAIAALAASVGGIADRLALLHALSAAIHERLQYLPGSTSVLTEAEAALTAGAGVCQDHAHVFIAAARHLGIPARYVSGYLMMPDRTEQTATHAWAEAHVEGLGWVGFDAANAVCPDDKYIRIAAGLDYKEAAPITGVRGGLGGETLAVAVIVEQ
jgi:transglutaminase-like putative cysteine protease